MGDWGPGALENDHAQDLLSIELDRWRTLFDEGLSGAASWDEIQGLLVYVHLLVTHGDPGTLSLLPRPPRGDLSSVEVARAWKARYLALASSTPYARPEARAAREAEVVRVFDALIARACPTDAPKKKSRTKKR